MYPRPSSSKHKQVISIVLQTVRINFWCDMNKVDRLKSREHGKVNTHLKPKKLFQIETGNVSSEMRGYCRRRQEIFGQHRGVLSHFYGDRRGRSYVEAVLNCSVTNI